MDRPTIHRLAGEAGVDPRTARRVIDGNKPVTELARRAVINAAKRLRIELPAANTSKSEAPATSPTAEAA